MKKVAAISCLIPKSVADKVYDDLTPAVEVYQKFLPGSAAQVIPEFRLWKKRWTDIVAESNSTTLSSSSISNTTIRLKRNVKNKFWYQIQ